MGEHRVEDGGQEQETGEENPPALPVPGRVCGIVKQPVEQNKEVAGEKRGGVFDKPVRQDEHHGKDAGEAAENEFVTPGRPGPQRSLANSLLVY